RLRRAGSVIVRVAVDIELVGRRVVDQLEPVRLQHGILAELRVEPSQLGEKQRVGEPQIVFEIGEIIVLPETVAQHLVALEAEMANRMRIRTPDSNNPVSIASLARGEFTGSIQWSILIIPGHHELHVGTGKCGYPSPARRRS